MTLPAKAGFRPKIPVWQSTLSRDDRLLGRNLWRASRLPPATKRCTRLLLVAGSMMTVVALEHLGCHAKVSSGFPSGDVVFHQPGRAGMSHPVRRENPRVQPRISRDPFKTSANPSSQGMPAMMDYSAGVVFGISENEKVHPVPAPKVGKQAVRHHYRRATLVAVIPLPTTAPIDDARLQIDPSGIVGHLPPQLGQNSGPGSRVESDDQKPPQVRSVLTAGKLQARPSPTFNIETVAHRRLQKAGGLISGQGITVSLVLIRKRELWFPQKWVLSTPVSDSGRQVLQLPTSRLITHARRCGGVLVRLDRLENAPGDVSLTGRHLDVAERHFTPEVQNGL